MLPLSPRGGRQPRHGRRTRRPTQDGALRPETDDSGRWRRRLLLPRAKIVPAGRGADAGSKGGEQPRLSLLPRGLSQGCPIEFIPIKPLAATDSSAPGNCARHSRAPSRDRGRVWSKYSNSPSSWRLRPLPSTALRLVFRPAHTDTHRHYGRYRLWGRDDGLETTTSVYHGDRR